MEHKRNLQKAKEKAENHLKEIGLKYQGVQDGFDVWSD